MKLSLIGLAQAFQSLADAVVARAESGAPIDDDFLYQHQPQLSAHFFEELTRNLAELRDHPEKHAEFFAIYVCPEAPGAPDGHA